MFFSDLVKQIKHPHLSEFLRVSSYKGMESTGKITLTEDPKPEWFCGKHVLVVEDMHDTGTTLKTSLKTHIDTHTTTEKIGKDLVGIARLRPSHLLSDLAETFRLRIHPFGQIGSKLGGVLLQPLIDQGGYSSDLQNL